VESFSIRVAKDDQVFSASHFITLGDEECERLHGHDYRVTAEVRGNLDASCCVVDFILLRSLLREIIADLDHCVLLPIEYSRICIDSGPKEVEVTCDDLRWVFPQRDCKLLPLANTTTERLAEYIARRLLANLSEQSGARVDSLKVEIEECYGVSAAYRLTP